MNPPPAFAHLLLAVESRVATLTLNRPQVLNALSTDLLRELEHAFVWLLAEPEVRVVLLAGAGGRAFAAGADIAEIEHADSARGQEQSAWVNRLFRRIETSAKPVLALLDGYALGGGCELALACTLRLAGPAARIGMPELKLGLIPGYGGTQRLPRLIGRGAALRMILTSAVVDAPEALRLGLVDELLPSTEALLERGRELALAIAAMPPAAVAATLDAVDRGADLPLDQALTLESGLFGRLCGTPEMREGARAFLEKRPPRWP